MAATKNPFTTSRFPITAAKIPITTATAVPLSLHDSLTQPGVRKEGPKGPGPCGVPGSIYPWALWPRGLATRPY